MTQPTQVQFDEYERRSREATAAGALAFEKLLRLAEIGRSGQAKAVAKILASLYNGEDFPMDPYDLRSLDIELSDAALACLDALRWARADLHTLVVDGGKRTLAALEVHGIEWPPER